MLRLRINLHERRRLCKILYAYLTGRGTLLLLTPSPQCPSTECLLATTFPHLSLNTLHIVTHNTHARRTPSNDTTDFNSTPLAYTSCRTRPGASSEQGKGSIGGKGPRRTGPSSWDDCLQPGGSRCGRAGAGESSAVWMCGQTVVEDRQRGEGADRSVQYITKAFLCSVELCM